MTAAETVWLAPFDGHETWYRVVGDLDAARAGEGPAPVLLPESPRVPFWEERPASMAAAGGFLRRHDA